MRLKLRIQNGYFKSIAADQTIFFANLVGFLGQTYNYRNTRTAKFYQCVFRPHLCSRYLRLSWYDQ